MPGWRGGTAIRGVALASRLHQCVRMARVFAMTLLFAAAVSCTGRGDGAGDETFSCEWQRLGYHYLQYPLVNLLIVVDRSAAMAPYAPELADHLRELADTLLRVSSPDSHIAIVAADAGSLTAAPVTGGCPTPDGAFIADERLPWFTCSTDPAARCPDRNFEGGLADALACIGALPVVNGAARQPLRAAAEALENPSADGFHRPAALPYVLIIAGGDDESPGPVQDYIDRMRARLDPDHEPFVGVIAPPGTERLNAALASSYRPSDPIAIDQPSWSTAVDWIVLDHLLPDACLRGEPGSDISIDPTDLDPDNPGVQPDCVVTVTSERNRPGLPVGTVIPPCRMSTPSQPQPDNPVPCWWLGPEVSTGCELWPNAEGIELTSWRCVTECR